MAENTGKDYRNRLLYSVFVRDYGKNGTFKDLEDDLSRIRDLGTDIIWLMPIHPIGKKGRKGSVGSPYAISDYRTINPDFGTMGDFIRLVDAIHEKEMKCIIDVVYNHTSPDSVLAKEHNEWFRHNEKGEPVPKVLDWYDIVDLDYSHRELWDYQIETLKYWAKYVDGFRCDVAPLLPLEFWKEAREEVSKVRPDAFWLAESVDGGFVRSLRKDREICLSDSEIYQAFDATYDYDIFSSWKDYLTGEGTLSSYLHELNRQEMIYPDNYIKMHFLENHDRQRAAAMTSDLGLLRHQTAFSFFEKGLAFLYNGQERSAKVHPTLFETDPIDWSGNDLSGLIKRMMKIKRSNIMAEGEFAASEIRKGVVCAKYEMPGESLYGFFRVGSKECAINAPLPEAEFVNEYNGEKIDLHERVLYLGEDPVIIRVKG